jgi:hypothetical protein
VLPVINNEQNDVSLIVVQMEPKRNTETEGSSGRRLMTDEQNASGEKSALPQTTGTNKRVLHGSIIRDKPNDAGVESEVLFLEGPWIWDQNPWEYSPVASASKRRKDRSEHMYHTWCRT